MKILEGIIRYMKIDGKHPLQHQTEKETKSNSLARQYQKINRDTET